MADTPPASRLKISTPQRRKAAMKAYDLPCCCFALVLSGIAVVVLMGKPTVRELMENNLKDSTTKGPAIITPLPAIDSTSPSNTTLTETSTPFSENFTDQLSDHNHTNTSSRKKRCAKMLNEKDFRSGKIGGDQLQHSEVVVHLILPLAIAILILLACCSCIREPGSKSDDKELPECKEETTIV